MSDEIQDPILTSGRREAIVAIVAWGVALVYCVTYCYRYGYDASANPKFVLGIPHWVFFGVIVPWLACLAFSWWFSFIFIREDELPSEAAPPVDEAQREP